MRAGIVAFLALVLASAACGADEATTSPPVTSAIVIATSSGTTANPTLPPTAVQTTPPTIAVTATAPPPTSAVVSASPSPAVATAAFDAWIAGDVSGVVSSIDPAVVEFMRHQALEPDGWSGPACDAAAGSTHCSWASAAANVVLWVANQSGGSTVMGAALEPASGAVAVWPLTTPEEAANTQLSVDAGHSPWQLDQDAVALSYAENVLGLDQPYVEHTPLNVRVVDARGVEVGMHLVQPARQGAGGIWAIRDVYASGIPH